MAASKRPLKLSSLIAVTAAVVAMVLCSEVPRATAAAQKKSADAGGKNNGPACNYKQAKHA